jgi:O-antigen ligase
MKRYPIYWLPFFLAPLLWPGIFMAETAVDLMAFATALFAAAVMWQGNGRRFSEPWSWTFLLLILIPVLEHLIANDLRSPWYAWRETLYITAAWLVFMMAREHGSSLLSSSVFAWILTVTAYVYIAYALIQAYDLRFFASGAGERLFPVWSNMTARFPGPLMQANWQGIFLALVVCAQVFQGILRHEKLRMWAILAIVPFTGLFLTSSRSSLLAVALGLGAMLYLTRQRRPYLMAVAIAIGIAVALTAIVNVTVPPSNEASNLVARFESGGYMTRLLIWGMCIRLALSHFFFGIGWGNLPAYGVDGMIDVVHHHRALSGAISALGAGGNAWAHNILLQGWVDGGIPGLLAVMLLCAGVLKQWRAWYAMRPALPDGRVLGALFAGMLLFHGMLSVSVMQPYFMSLLALSMAAAFPSSGAQEDEP